MDDINYSKQFIKSEFFYQNLKYEFQNIHNTLKPSERFGGEEDLHLWSSSAFWLFREIEEIPSSKDRSKRWLSEVCSE